MTIRLSVNEKSTSGSQEEPVVHAFEGPTITLGRDKGCDVVLSRQAVSRQHARISVDGDLGFVEDLGSSFGTQVNGETLPKGEKRLLKSGDVIVIAQFDITFSQERMIPAPGLTENTSFVSRAMVRGALRGVLSVEDPFFRFMNGDREGEKVPISEAQELIVGRDPTAEIRLSDDLVSRRHAKIRRDLAGVHVEDLESRNGVKVNRRKVRHRTLKDRDEVEIGAARLLFVDPNALGEAPKVEVPRSNPRPAPRRPTEASVAKPTPEAPAKPTEGETEKPPAEAPDKAEAPKEEPPPTAKEEPAAESAQASEEAPAEGAGDGETAPPEGEEGEQGDEGELEPEDPDAWEGSGGVPEELVDEAGVIRIGGFVVPGGSQTLIVAGLGLVGLFALVMMIALLLGA